MSAERNRFYVALLVGLLLPMQAQAISVMDGQFEPLIQKAEVLIKAKVFPQKKSPFEMITFKAKTISILKSDGRPVPGNLSFEAPFPVWPDDFAVPYEENQVVLLVLRRVKGELAVVNHAKAIIPASKNKIDHKGGSTIKRKVFDELHAFLPHAKDEFSQALVLVRLTNLASKSDEKILLPYARSKNKWMQRAVDAYQIKADPTTERIQAAVADFKNHLSKKPDAHNSITSEDRLFWEIYKDVQWVSRCGAHGMDKKMTERAKTYLPIYRVLIDKAPSGSQRVHIGIEALKNVGGREDIYRLYKHLNDKKASMRHDVLEGIGRILGMKIKRPIIRGYEIPDNLAPNVKQWESDSRAAIQKAMKEEGLLGEN